MASDVNGATGGRGRKRLASKAATRRTATKVKATVHLSVESSQRLSVHAAMTGMDRSELVEHLIATHLRRFVVSDRGREESGNGGREESGITGMAE